jgi:hypothetical protein
MLGQPRVQSRYVGYTSSSALTACALAPGNQPAGEDAKGEPNLGGARLHL